MQNSVQIEKQQINPKIYEHSMKHENRKKTVVTRKKQENPLKTKNNRVR